MPTTIGFAISLLLLECLVLDVISLPCDDDGSCKSGSCNSSGACICDLPHPSTIFDGDRPFLGGKSCDEEMIMCDGTNEFWCENGGKCEEIVQGERYKCKCFRGFAGEHCEHSGTPCGEIFCFNQAQCSLAHACDCPPHWKGSADCSLPTRPQTDPSINSTTANFPQDKNGTNTNWMLGFLAVSCSAGAVAGGAMYAKKLFKKKSNSPAAPRFEQLSRMQSQATVEDDDDDENDSMIRTDTSHL